jgi:hypothetical protein
VREGIPWGTSEERGLYSELDIKSSERQSPKALSVNQEHLLRELHTLPGKKAPDRILERKSPGRGSIPLVWGFLLAG